MRGVAGPFEGTLTGAGQYALQVTLIDGSDFTISPEQVERAEVLGRGRHVALGALVGGGVGLGVGVAWLISSRNDCDRDLYGFCDGLADAFSDVYFLVPPLVGAGAGALVGYFIQTPRWVPGVLPGRSGNGQASLSLTWSIPAA